MKGRYFLLILVAAAIVSIFSYNLHPNDKQKDVVILQIIEHEALNATRRGIQDYLKDCCRDVDVAYENAQGNTTLALHIGQKVATSAPKVVVAIGTIAAQAFLKNNAVPVVFSSVTDPVSAGLVKDLNMSQTHFTGVSNMIEIAPQLKLIKGILPDTKKIGLIYNSAESNSIQILKQLKEIAPEFDLEIVESVIASSNDVVIATQSLINKGVGAIFISNDNTALSSIQGITKTATAGGIPVFCSDIDTINSGVLVAFGPDQYEIGIQTGKMIEKLLLKGAKPESMPVEFPIKVELKINLKVAEQLKLSVPESMLQAASEVIR